MIYTECSTVIIHVPQKARVGNTNEHYPALCAQRTAFLISMCLARDAVQDGTGSCINPADRVSSTGRRV